MKRGLLLVLLLSATATASHAAPRLAPTLRIVQRDPLVITGQHFRSRELVTVTVVAKHTWIRARRATLQGTWRMRLDGVFVSHCDAVFVTAVGRSGSRARLKFPQLPACIPA